MLVACLTSSRVPSAGSAGSFAAEDHLSSSAAVPTSAMTAAAVGDSTNAVTNGVDKMHLNGGKLEAETGVNVAGQDDGEGGDEEDDEGAGDNAAGTGGSESR